MKARINNDLLGRVHNRAAILFHELEDVGGRPSKHFFFPEEDSNQPDLPITQEASVRNLYPDQDYNTLVRKLAKSDAMFKDKYFHTSTNELLTRRARISSSIKWLRPREISTEARPRFVDGSVDRFDINQGEVGNCWFLSALANLAENKRCFDRVVPTGQSFRDKDNYRGIFRFRFFR